MARTAAVELPRPSYYTGDIVEGTAVLTTDGEGEVKGFHLDVIAKEETSIKRGRGDSTRYYASMAELFAWRISFIGPGPLAAGTYRFPFQFQIPQQGLPSYTGTHASITYDLALRLDVPWAIDAVWSGQLHVYYDRPSVRQFAQPVRFQSRDPGPTVFVELDGDRFFAGELIGARVTLANFGSVSLHRLYARLVGSEWARAQNQEESTMTMHNEVIIPIDTVHEGTPLTFAIVVPPDVPSSYRGTFSYCSFAVQVGLDVGLGRDIVAETPLVIVR